MQVQMNAGDKTRLAEEDLWGLPESDDSDDEAGLLWSKEYISKMDETQLFREKLLERMVFCGFTGDIHDEKALCHFLERSCEDAKVSIPPKTLKNWINTGKVTRKTSGRENLYKLCFALKMNAGEAATFFHKAVFARPFNYKNLYESVCYFCLNTGRSYPEVERLVAKIQSLPRKESDDPIGLTVTIGSSIERCSTEDDLIEYWVQHSAGFEPQRQTAREEIKELLEACYVAGTKHCGKSISTPDELLNAIYGFNPRVVSDGTKPYARAFSRSSFPEAVKRNFPQRQQIQNILNGDASDEVLRKTLIVLSFFEYFVSDDGTASFDEFEEILNDRLQKCGYIETYWRNPFDWVFGHCATQEAPLLALQELIDKLVLEAPGAPDE